MAGRGHEPIRWAPMDDETTEPGATGEPDAATEGASAALEARSGAELADIVPDALPATRLRSAAPAPAARGLAFVSIVIGGVCGGLIGYAFTDLQCNDGCTIWAGLSGVLGALIGAVGVAVVAVLVLRAMDEWETVKDRNPDQHPARKRPT